jgi:DNA-binding transcriptional MerR regulator
METELTIQDVAKRTGLSIDTLRYYERIGLIGPVGRAQNGHRRYTQQDLDWIALVVHLRKTGMPRAQMARVARMRLQGLATTVTEFRIILEEHQRSLQQRMQELEQHMVVLQHKIAHIKDLEAQQNAESHPARASAQGEAEGFVEASEAGEL